MKTLLKSMIIGLSLITGSPAMEVKSMDVEGENLIPQGQTARELTTTEKKNAYKMWLLKENFEKSNNGGILPEIPRDILTVIGQTLHDLCGNPVLDGELLYKDKGIETIFKIGDLVKKDGTIDLSDPTFGNASQYLLITTDPEQFFNIVENSYRVIILIAPMFLIEDNIGSSAKQFEPIVANWNEVDAPIGVFYKEEWWSINTNCYCYLISSTISSISENNLHENWFRAQQGGKNMHFESGIFHRPAYHITFILT